MTLYERLKEMRRARGFTLKGLAARTGLSVSYLSDLERGRTMPPLPTLQAVAAALEITILDLLTGVEFAGEQTQAGLPPGLADLLDDPEYRPELTQEWVQLLGKIQLRGKRPQSKHEWLELYLHLKRILGP
jgi:XRE family transcriptional regulator, regulator of sulfur utilization